MRSHRIMRLVVTGALSAACMLGIVACSSSSSTASSGVAATVNGTEISEQTVTDFVQNFRETQGLTDEDTWGKWMAKSSMTPSQVRDQIIDYFVGIDLTRQAAEENGVSVSDADVDAQVASMKANYSDDDAWQSALKQAGTTEEGYRDSVRNAMLENALKEKVTAMKNCLRMRSSMHARLAGRRNLRTSYLQVTTLILPRRYSTKLTRDRFPSRMLLKNIQSILPLLKMAVTWVGIC